ncbi:MAG: O-antigen ligase family protein [Spiribacter salinus]|uniref:O-antigen ligase family protein n=1 Tax=Spiribacter salinus TaxID=1335746 RepID=A0A540VPI1_9GAMM|nr:MAG: O-antigen ligase family protein [Spiribacter salinus]
MTTLNLSRFPSSVLGPERYLTSPLPGVHWIALASVLTVSVMMFISRDVTRLGELLTFLLGILSARAIARTDRHGWLLAVMIAYAMWMLLVDLTVSITPEDVNVEKHQRHYVKQYFFLFAGWWVGGTRWGPNLLLLGGLIGCAAGLAILSNPEHWIRAVDGSRTDFGFHNAQHTALYAGSCLFALFHLAGESRNFRDRRLRLTVLTACTAGGLLCAFILAATQTRQTWVALTLAAVCVLLALSPSWPTLHAFLRRHRGSSAALFTVFALILVTLNPLSGAWQRTANEWEHVEAYVAGETPQRYSSITIRLMQWRTAMDFISDRPLMGYGGRSNGTLMEMSDLPEALKDSYGHFHNSYLESTLHYGLIGTALWLIGLLVLFARGWKAVRKGRLKGLSAVFAVGWVPYFAGLNLFETYINYESAYFAVFVAGGALYGLTMHQPVNGSVRSAPRDGGSVFGRNAPARSAGSPTPGPPPPWRRDARNRAPSR